MRVLIGAALVLALALIRASAAAQSPARPPSEPFPGMLDEHPAIAYAATPARDPVARLRDEIASGKRTLPYDERGGYLRSVLDALHISEESQVLVFSKTGIQRAATGPRNPRALYFNDAVVVGYIAGARFLEIAAQDPQNGVIFYTIDQMVAGGTAAAAEPPGIERRTNCLTCHVSGSTLEVPGMIARSMFTARNGEVLPQLGSFIVDHRTPLSKRWGGWFVTGRYDSPPYGGVGHMGSVTTTIHPSSGPAGTSNEVLIEWLNRDPAGDGYSSTESDIVSLMVFDHQMRAMNLLTRLNWEARVAARNDAAEGSGALKGLVDEVVDYWLFVDEAPPPARLTPRPEFARQFMSRGPKDRLGRSLRDLDLERRLLRYPCSYMIYSDAFAGLPDAVRMAIYSRIAEILEGNDGAAKHAHLSASDRAAILEILRDTIPGFPQPRAAR